MSIVADGATPSAFRFTGSWREFAPIAFTNLLLTVVTLGIYRFWATRRERQYLWSNSAFIDEPLEWTGTGLELFIGFLIVLALFGIPVLVLQFGLQALVLQGHAVIAGLVAVAMFVFIFYLSGVARFRALRYRLGRTYWRGIRGGSDDQGLGYGWSYIWKTAAGYIAAGLLVPWSMTSLWNERWQAMSFGSHRFSADAEFSPLMWRFFLFYITPFVVIFGAIIAGALVFAAGGITPETFQNERSIALLVGVVIVVVLAIYLILPLIYLLYYSAFFRVVVGALRLHDIEFAFTARTRDWFKLFLVDVLLVIGTLGIGFIFLGYRHWKFFIIHMEAYGEIDVEALSQSETQISRHGEGLLDAFDVGAI